MPSMACRVASSLLSITIGDFTDAMNGKRVLCNFYLNSTFPLSASGASDEVTLPVVMRPLGSAVTRCIQCAVGKVHSFVGS